MSHMPFPSNENESGSPQTGPVRLSAKSKPNLPWAKINAADQTPMFFRIHLHGGRTRRFAYADLRDIDSRDAGCVDLHIVGYEKYQIRVEGRHLNEFADLLDMGKIRSFTEFGPRTFDQPEESPSIDKITIEATTGPPSSLPPAPSPKPSRPAG